MALKKHRGPRIVAIYCRISSEDQQRNGRSLENQQQLLSQYATERWPDLGQEIYSEQASARKVERRRYQALMRDIKCGRVAAVCATEVSRLWRNAAAAISEQQLMVSHNTDLMIWSQGIDTSTAFGKLAFGLFALFAQFESDTISERTKRAVHAAKVAGRKGPGRRPYGWTVGDDCKLRRCDKEQAAIDVVLALRDRNTPWATVAAYLNEKGIETVSGRPWDAGGIRLVCQAVIRRRQEEANLGVSAE